jgi:hypothetical protein
VAPQHDDLVLASLDRGLAGAHFGLELSLGALTRVQHGSDAERDAAGRGGFALAALARGGSGSQPPPKRMAASPAARRASS